MYEQLVIPGFSQHNTAMPYLTTNEVIDRTGWTRAWVSSLFGRGKLRGIKDEHGQLLIDAESLEEYLAAPRDKGGRPKKRKYNRR